mmetsp:Transcript_1191/g.1774  ORF Transcript_1191/g.1774 Transcript_1191/m.1774 type:complete len:931 (+) Transcript_1191:55-2847(+)
MSVSPGQSIVIIVDPYSTGCMIGQEIAKRGYKLLKLWTKNFSDDMKTHIPISCRDVAYYAEVQEQNGWTLEDTDSAIRQAAGPQLTIIGCIAGGEAGIDMADALSEKLGVVTNGTAIPNRRDKKVQQELIKAKGLRSIRQSGGDKFEQVEEFLKSEHYPVVLKPVDSAGSDGVKLCQDFNEAKEHFHRLLKVEAVNGGMNKEVLCQEFLKGKEYVVDQVSRDGVHKATNVWVYDKRPTNGSAFVYFGLVPVDPTTDIAKMLVEYARGALDALCIRNGPSHGEIIVTQDGPCLVEMNCRAHGADGCWVPLARALTGGYSQIDASVDALFDTERFDALPDLPPSLQASGLMVYLISFSEGIIKSTPGYEVISKLPSFIWLQPSATIGSHVDFTVDLNSSPGTCVLVNKDPDVLKKDLDLIRYLEEINAMFGYETRKTHMRAPSFAEKKPFLRRAASEGAPSRFMSNRMDLRGPLMKRMTTVDASKECVVVVDPYSTGCVLVKEIQSRSYKVIALWTKGFSEEMKTHVPLKCGEMIYHAHVDEQDTLADTMKAVYKTAGVFRVVACIAGGEAGVDLADSLSERLEVRTNGTDIPNRRDKKIQQELIKAEGLRSVRQAGGAKFSDVEEFLKTEQYPVVLKPVDSAGSDGVKLCHDFDEAKEHFHHLLEVEAVNGGMNTEVLCQEFLKGKEYVIDHVSRDGIHKTMQVWVYDKRPANGSAFVYFGMVPVPTDSPEARMLIPYIRTVLDSLGMRNGPSHGEAIITANGPCLVEMNCRAHGGDGNWSVIAKAINGGYSQIDASIDSYLNKQQFAILPDMPPAPKASGQEVMLVSYSRGTVKSCPGFEVIKQMESFVYLESGVKEGTFVEHTTDLVTSVGSAIVMHHDATVLKKDVARIREMEKNNELFEYKVTGSMFKAASKVNLGGIIEGVEGMGV